MNRRSRMICDGIITKTYHSTLISKTQNPDFKCSQVDLVKSGFTLNSIIYVGIYALIYQHTILGEGMVSRDGLPCGVLSSDIFKIEKYCLGLEVRSPDPSQVLATVMVALKLSLSQTV